MTDLGARPPDSEGCRWARSRLPAYLSGLLVEPGEEERFRSHLDECERCRPLLEEFRADPEGVMMEALEEGMAHLPASLIGRWPRIKDDLPELERAMVLRHLDDCAQCRLELEFLEQNATATEPASDRKTLSADPAPVLGLGDRVGRHGQGPPPPSSRRLTWLLGGWALAATSAALVIFFALGGDRKNTIGAPAASLLLHRQRAATLPTILLEEETKAIVLAVPEAANFGKQVVIIDLVEPSGRSRRIGAFAGVDFSNERGLVLMRPRSGWPTGDYHLHLSPGPAPNDPQDTAAEALSYHFRLERTQPR